MAKENNGYDLSDALGKAVGTANSAGQSAINDVHSDETSDPSERAGSSLQNGANGLRNAVEAPGRIKDTAHNVKEGAKKAGEAIKKAPENIKKAKQAISDPVARQKALNAAKDKAIEGIKNAPAKAWEKMTRRPRERLRRMKKTAQMVKNAAQALFKVAQAIAKALMKVIIWLVTTLGPILFGFILICALCFFFMNNMSTTGDVITDSESLSELNQTVLTPNEEVQQVDVSSGTKIINAYYTYFSQKSLWVLNDGTVYNCHNDKVEKNKDVNANKMPYHIDTNGNKIYEPVQYGSSQFIEIYKYDPFTGSGLSSGAELIQDKYGRESSFYLNASAIQSIDNTLNHGQFRYPEQVVQKVKYKIVIDDNGSYHYELDQLADEQGNLYTTDVKDSSGNLLHTGTLSTAYTQDESETDAKYTNGKGYNLWIPYIDTDSNTGFSKVTKKVPGVWDYGFGSILHYIKYIEAHENRGNVTSFQVLDKNQWNLTNDSATGYQTNKITLDPVTGAYGTYYDGLSTGYNVNLYKQGVITEYSYDAWYAALSAGTTSTGGDFNNLWSGDGSSNDPTSDSFDTSRVYPLADTESYMIDWAVTPAGTISNKIETVWKNSGIPFDETENQKYTNGKINAMTIEHFDDGEATFKWDSSCVNTETGSYTNPRANLYLIQYEPTGNTQVDGKYSYTAYDDNGTEKYYLRIAIISMFNSDNTCKACGKKAVEEVHDEIDHSSCYRSYQVKIKDSYDDVTGTWQYKTYNSWKNKPLKVDSKTGDVTQNPYINVPEYWDPTLNDGAGGWTGSTTRYNLINSSGNCRYCGKSASYVSSYKATNHDNCKTIEYEYDVIKMKEVAFTDADWGLNEQSINLTRYIEGTQWDKEPNYSGEPDMSGVTGAKYYEDYFTHYETYIPEKVQGDFNFNEIKNQTGLDEEQLLALLDREGISAEIETMGFEDYFEGGTAFATVEKNGAMKNYIGPGVSVITFETSQFNPSMYGNVDYPSYGCCQMIEVNIKQFYKWICEDPDREALWDKIFDGCDIVCANNSEFTRRWKDADTVLSTDEYVTWGLYQLSYMYYSEGLGSGEGSVPTKLAAVGIDFNRSRVLQEFVFETTNQGWSSSAYRNAINSGAINSSSTDEDIINAVCDQYATVCTWKGGASSNLTKTMRNKWNTTIRNFYLDLATKNYPVIGWDAEKNVFSDENVSGSSSGGSGWSLGKLWKTLTLRKTDSEGNVYWLWEDMFKNSQIGIEQHTTSGLYYGTDANAAVERIHYKTNAVASQDINWEIAKIFATIDKVPITTYYPLTDDFFILKYEELFSSDIGKKWSTGNGFAKYFGSSWSNVFAKSSSSTNQNETDYSDITFTQLNEFNIDENSVILKMVVAAGSSTDSNKMAVAIHSVAEGVVLDIGSDIIYGGSYIAIEYDNCVVYYGGVTPLNDLEKGDAVHKQEMIGLVPFDSYFYLAMKTSVNGSYIDPTKLLENGGVNEVVDLGRTFLGTDYEWGGTGRVFDDNGNRISGSCCSPADHAKAETVENNPNPNTWQYAFDCSGFMRYLFTQLNYTVSGGANDLSHCGVDITADYTVNGSINWSAVPVGTVVFMNTAGDSRIDHVGLWTGYSLLHASGGNPWSNGAGIDTYYQSKKVCFRPQKNHAINGTYGNMVREDFLGSIPDDIYATYGQIRVHGKPVLVENYNWWVSKVVQINDFSSCKNS